VDFTLPFASDVRRRLLAAAGRAGIDALDGAVYGVTQGPRLETAAEIDRLERDGCGVVGMTAMPEAGLARELGLAYAICAVVVNWAAGRDPTGGDIHGGMDVHLQAGVAQFRQLLGALLAP
jgi:purine nucleoside phosphorylase